MMGSGADLDDLALEDLQRLLDQRIVLESSLLNGTEASFSLAGCGRRSRRLAAADGFG